MYSYAFSCTHAHFLYPCTYIFLYPYQHFRYRELIENSLPLLTRGILL
jgi:hypothetical protein